MLDKGNPPDDWAALLAAASSEEVRLRMAAALPPEAQ
jgi:toxin YhaV